MDGCLHVSSRQDTGPRAEATRVQSSSQTLMGLDSGLFLCVLCLPEGHWEHERREPGAYKDCGTNVFLVVFPRLPGIRTPSPCS